MKTFDVSGFLTKLAFRFSPHLQAVSRNHRLNIAIVAGCAITLWQSHPGVAQVLEPAAPDPVWRTDTYTITGSLMRSPMSTDSSAEPGSPSPDTSSYGGADVDRFDDRKANVLLQSAQYEELVASCNAILDQNSSCAWARFYRGCAYFHQDELRLAVRDFKQTSEDAYFGRTSHIWLGSAYEKLKKYQTSLTHYSEALKEGDKDPSLLVSRGSVMNLLCRWHDAVDDFDRALELQPGNAMALNHRGYAYAKLSNFDEAENDFSSAISIEPGYSYSYNYRGFVRNQKKDLDAAIQDFTRAIELSPEYAAAYMNRGCAYVAKGDTERADKDFRKAKEIDSHMRERRPVL